MLSLRNCFLRATWGHFSPRRLEDFLMKRLLPVSAEEATPLEAL